MSTMNTILFLWVCAVASLIVACGSSEQSNRTVLTPADAGLEQEESEGVEEIDDTGSPDDTADGDDPDESGNDGTEENEEKSRDFVLVSDLDDTLKITNVGDSMSKILNATLGKKAFSGMPELVRALAGGSEGRSFYVLSGSPEFLAAGVRSFLSEHAFPGPKEVILKSGLGIGNDGDLKQYKTEALTRIGSKESQPLVLLGDDTQEDPAAFSGYAASASGKVAAIYIHQVRGVTLPAKVRGFTTPFEVAVWEMQAGRLDQAAAEKIGETLLSANKKTFIPSFVRCPKQYDPLASQSLPGTLGDIYLKLREKVRGSC